MDKERHGGVQSVLFFGSRWIYWGYFSCRNSFYSFR